MRKTTNLFQINGKPILCPDGPVGIRYEDLDSANAGRDESGVMHRIQVRNKLASWAFTYDRLTEEEKTYMEGLFGDSATFSFTHPSRMDANVFQTSTCYRSNYGISWYNARLGLWSGYSFHNIEC